VRLLELVKHWTARANRIDVLDWPSGSMSRVERPNARQCLVDCASQLAEAIATIDKGELEDALNVLLDGEEQLGVAPVDTVHRVARALTARYVTVGSYWRETDSFFWVFQVLRFTERGEVFFKGHGSPFNLDLLLRGFEPWFTERCMQTSDGDCAVHEPGDERCLASWHEAHAGEWRLRGE